MLIVSCLFFFEANANLYVICVVQKNVCTLSLHFAECSKPASPPPLVGPLLYYYLRDRPTFLPTDDATGNADKREANSLAIKSAIISPPASACR